MTALLDSLTAGQLSTVYAEITGSQPVRFNSKINGRKRVSAALGKRNMALSDAMRACGLPVPGDPKPDDGEIPEAVLREMNAEVEAATLPAPVEAPKNKAARSPEQSGIALADMVVAKSGNGFRVYAYGHRTRENGTPGVEARLKVDGQPKGGFPNHDEAATWARETFKNRAAAIDWARNQASKGTRLNDQKYAGWTKTIVATVAF